MARQAHVDRSRLRILVLVDSSSFHAERYVRELRQQECHVLPASLERGALHHYRLKHRGLVSVMRYVASVPEIKLLIRRFAPDIVNPHFASGYGFSAALAGGGAVPIALHLWGSDILVAPKKSIFHRNKTRFALSSADCVFGDSEFLLQEADKIGHARSSQVIPWGIERRYLSLHRADNPMSGPLRVIVPRPHEPVYNNRMLLQALQPLLVNGSVRLTFPAWGSGFEGSRRMAEAIRPGAVIYYEKMNRDQFLAFAAEHDVYLSGSSSDSSPASLIEAMALGLIPVAADIPGVREWLSAANGFLFPLNEPAQLAGILTSLPTRREANAEMRRANLAKVKACGVFEDNIRRTIEIMRRLARRSRES
jgi:glycosyltransferase involved in cell wall biosynthesis